MQDIAIKCIDRFQLYYMSFLHIYWCNEVLLVYINQYKNTLVFTEMSQELF